MASGPTPVIHQGRYSLIRELGSGSFGEVWLARDNLQGDEVAIKLLGKHVHLDAALLETQIMTRLRHHQHVITIRNVELRPPLPFITMDFEPGGSLGEKMEQGQISMAEALRYTREGLDGLAHAHDEGVIHRDIKPDNLLISAQNRTVLSDFGIAEDTVREFLAVGAVYAPHAAPELLAGADCSRASDIFAMGCTMYRLLTGELPFPDKAATEAGVFTDPHRLNPQIPMAVTRVVQNALAHDPSDRYDDARAMLGALTPLRVARSWTRNDQDGELETWELRGSDGHYVLHLTEKARGGYRVKVTRDKGSGPRRVFQEDKERRSDAERVRRRQLLEGIDG
jgi:serine/threonine protein kinase